MTVPDPEWVRAKVQEMTALYDALNPTNPFRPVEGGRFSFDGEIPSNTKKGVSYHVTLRPGERPTCTCPARTHYAPNSECSHIRAVRKTLEAPDR